ncbi:MAG TPA: hypothetical protein VFO16_07195 [Pseudonocardiaceae bacterium]|nr:hypothetical protein [Pseudonocardiaceae bacterium]
MPGYADTKSIGSYLQAPEDASGTTFAEKIAAQGPQIEVVNWIWEHVTGEDLIEALIAPVTGNWARIEANGKAWINVGDALQQVSSNLQANVDKLGPSWEGEAADAFRRHIEVAWTAGLYAEAMVAKTLAKGFHFAAQQSEKLCQQALDLITKLINKLLSAIATLPIPVVGEARAIKLVWDAYQIYQAIMGIYEAVKATIAAVEGLIHALGDIRHDIESIKDVRNLNDLARLGKGLHKDASEVRENAHAIQENRTAIGEHVNEGRHALGEAKHHWEGDGHERTGRHVAHHCG